MRWSGIVSVIFVAGFIGCSTSNPLMDEGVTVVYYPNGAFKKVESRANGALDGLVRQYSSDGELVEVLDYRQDQLVMRNAYDPRGFEWIQEFYRNNQLMNRTKFDAQGYAIFEEKF